MNLYKEIIEILKENGKNKDDVKWAGNKHFKIPLYKFWEITNTEYDKSFGSQEVAEDLIVVGDIFWLERHEHDGSEWFEYKELPKMPQVEKDIDCLTIQQHNSKYCDFLVGWEDLFTLNNIDRRNDEQIF